MLTQDCLRRLWPRAPSSTVSAIARVAENVFASTGINTPLRQAHHTSQAEPLASLRPEGSTHNQEDK